MKPFLPVLLALVTASGGAGRAGEPTPPPKATNLWTATFPGYKNSSSSAPAVAPDGTVYVGTLHGALLAYTPAGQLKWSFPAGLEIKSAPAVAEDGTVYFGSRDRKFYALTPAGQLKWTFATGAWVDSSPAIAADGTVYFGGWDHFFYALHPDGSLQWKSDIGAIVDSSPAIAADGTVYFGAHDKKLHALRPDGTVRWTFATGGAIVSSPALGADGTIYFSAVDGYLYAVNADGAERWRWCTGGARESSPVVGAGGDICLGLENANGWVTAEGRERWRWGLPLSVDASAVALADRFYFSAPYCAVRALKVGALSWEQQLWSAEMGDSATASLTVSPEGILYVCAGFEIYAFRPPGERLSTAGSPWPMFRGNPRHTGRAGMVK